MARLDNFAIELQNEPGSTAYIFAYAPEESGKRILGLAKDYLVNSRGIPEDRITTVYGGRNDVLSEPRVQLMIRPAGAARPKPQKFTPNLEAFRGLFSEKPRYDFDPRDPADEESEKLRFPVSESEDFSGPSVTSVTHASLAEVLKQQKTAVVQIVAYNGEDSPPGAWRQLAKRDVERLKDLGIEPSRLKIVYGGSKKDAKVQLWVTAADAPSPVPDAGPEQPPRKTVSLSWLNDSELGYSGVERNAFRQMVRALQQFPTLRACVVVTFGTYEETEEATQPSILQEQETQETTTASEPEVEPEPEPADVPKLVEKWREELLQKYKIGADRFVVLFSRTDSFSNNMLETFVVPAGADLPNPNAMNEEAPQDQQPTQELIAPPVKGDSDKPGRKGKVF